MLETTVTEDVIEAELGRPVPQAEQWIADAVYLLSRHPQSSTFTQDDLDYVVRLAVLEHARNPLNVTEVDVRVDDGGTRRRYQSGHGRVTILPEWWDLLLPARSRRGSVGSMRIGVPAWRTPSRGTW